MGGEAFAGRGLAARPAPTGDLGIKVLLWERVSARESAATVHQDFFACSYNGMTLGIAACNEEIRLADAG